MCHLHTGLNSQSGEKNIETNIQYARTAHHVPALLLCHETC